MTEIMTNWRLRARLCNRFTKLLLESNIAAHGLGDVRRLARALAAHQLIHVRQRILERRRQMRPTANRTASLGYAQR